MVLFVCFFEQHRSRNKCLMGCFTYDFTVFRRALQWGHSPVPTEYIFNYSLLKFLKLRYQMLAVDQWIICKLKSSNDSNMNRINTADSDSNSTWWLEVCLLRCAVPDHYPQDVGWTVSTSQPSCMQSQSHTHKHTVSVCHSLLKDCLAMYMAPNLHNLPVSVCLPSKGSLAACQSCCPNFITVVVWNPNPFSSTLRTSLSHLLEVNLNQNPAP